MGFEIHVYLISAGPTQLPVFNCTLRILLRVPRVNSHFRNVQLPVTVKATLRTPFPAFHEYIPRTGKNCFV